MSSITKKSFSLLLVAVALLFGHQSSAATPFVGAQRMISTPAVTKLDQLEVYSYTVGFKNTGRATWSRLGTGAVTIKTTESVKNEHWFASAAWIDKTTAARMNTSHVKTGEIGYFTLILQAPTAARTFTNSFALYTGNGKINGTEFKLPITVTTKVAAKDKQKIPTSTVASPAPSTATTAAATNLPMSTVAKASLMLRSTDTVSLESGQSTEIKVAFKNTGDRNWRNDDPSLVTLQLNPASANGLSFKDESWRDTAVIEPLEVPLTKIGELAFFTFKIKAPASAGTFKPQFRLVLDVNGPTAIPGSEFNMLVNVTSPPPPPVLAVQPGPSSGIVCAASDSIPVASDSAQNPGGDVTGLCRPPRIEPFIRVGLDDAEGQLGVTSDSPFQVLDKNNVAVMTVTPNATVFLAYDITTKLYSVIGPGPVLTSPEPYHVHAVNEPSIIRLTTYSNVTSFNSSLNDNVFRGSIEIAWNNNDGKLWIVNELKMEDYLRGLAESGNSPHIEFHKAQVVAARSYAMYQYDTKAKSRSNPFDIYASVQDQAYRGYNIEGRIPKVSQAVDLTRGQIVTYQGQVVITPYSASTDGRSRTWKEAWGGTDKPWLVNQAVPQDVGRTRYGHGIGLSQLAAQDMASKEGKTYIEILKFFYVGTEVTQWY